MEINRISSTSNFKNLTMRAFLFRLSLFIVILIATGSLLKNISKKYVSTFYGNDCIDVKYIEFMDLMENFNSIIVGSSRLYRNLDPTILDTTLAEYQLRTYNLACPATFNPEAYIILERLLSEIPEGKIKYAFVELQELDLIAPENIYTKKYYWLEAESVKYIFAYTANSQINYLMKGYIYTSYAAAYLFQQIEFSSISKLINRNTPDSLYLGRHGNGYFTIEEHAKSLPEGNKYQQRHLDLLKNPKKLAERAQTPTPSTENTNLQSNSYHLQYLSQLISIANKKGVQVIFIVSPKLEISQELIDTYSQLPMENTIPIEKYCYLPEYHQISYNFDVGHLNRDGSTFFSSAIGSAMKDKLRNRTY